MYGVLVYHPAFVAERAEVLNRRYAGSVAVADVDDPEALPEESSGQPI
jgi:hypothetical protein